MDRFFENRDTRTWRERQEAKCETDDNFVDEDSDSQDDLVIEADTGVVLRRLRAAIQFSSGAGWFVADRCGRRWAVDNIGEGVFELNLRGRHVRDIMRGIGWQREVPRR